MRISLGFARTICNCSDCSEFCKWMPGYLIPEDLPRLAGTTDEQTILDWAFVHLLASSGFLLNDPEAGLRRVPTLVPARQDNGCACHWLGSKGECTVHENAPYGCAMFDQHQSRLEHTRRANMGALNVLAEWDHFTRTRDSLYYMIWNALSSRQLTAPNRLDSRTLYLKTLNQK